MKIISKEIIDNERNEKYFNVIKLNNKKQQPSKSLNFDKLLEEEINKN